MKGVNIERKPVDKIFLLSIAGVVLFGLIILLSASGPEGYERFGDSYFYVKRQIISGVVPGVLLMTIFSFIPYQWLKKIAAPMLLISIGLLVMVFIPGLGTDLNTFAKSWVNLGLFTFQPSEVVKLTFLIYLAAWMEARVDHLNDFNSGLVPFLGILGVIAVLMFLQPDIGTLSIIISMAFIVYFVAGGPLRFILGLAALAVPGLWILFQLSPYRLQRFTTFLHPELDPTGAGYQINQALLAVGSGGMFGRGYGHSLQKFQYLPEVVGDSIFAIMSEELGFFLTAAALCGFLFFLWRGILVAERAKSDFARFLVAGIIGWFGIQAIVNIGSTIAIMPMTGVPLPFVSYGGTSLAVCLAACGIILSISRES